jgi:hypothetical protein
MNPGLWIDETNAAAWAESCRKAILGWLAPLAGEGAEGLDSLQVGVFPPTQEDARRAFETNGDLRGRVRMDWAGESLEIETPMPFHGVFLSRRPESQKGFVSVWAPWLAEAPGFRVFRPTSQSKRGEVKWRAGLPGGKFAEATLSQMSKSEAANLERLPYFGSPGNYPEWLQPALAVCGLREAQGKAEDMPLAWQDLLTAHQADLSNPEHHTDQDDLEHRVLMTYPVWLKHRIAGELLKVAEAVKAGHLGKQMLSVLAGLREGSPGLAEEAWATVVARQALVADRLLWSIHCHQSADHADLIDPINPLDLVSRITRVKRIHLPASKLAEVAAEFRQNHPSFRGRLCPVESPESEQVGLTLQLAAGANVDFNGRIQPTTDPALQLGYGAGLIPFFAHNDGARNMMGAKNLRQAVPVRKRMRPAVETGGEATVEAFSAPLVEIGLCPDAKGGDGGFALGRDLLVAYLPWKGLNFEDAIVVGEQVVKEGLLDLAFHKTVRKAIKVGWMPADPVDNIVMQWSEGGLAKTGAELFGGSPIARFVWDGKGQAEPMEIHYDERTPAILKSIRFTRRTPWTGGILEYELETPVPVKPGDKLMGRHGNKGVVGAILPEADMPRLPDSLVLPAHLRNRPIDILLNPHGVISRMNLGQLIETHLGWVLHFGARKPEDLAKDEGTCPAPLARAFNELPDHAKIRKALKETGLDEYGRIKLRLPDGGETESPVVVGFQHIVRLKHVPEMKSQARQGGSDALYSARTGQAAHGRRLGGGQRLGEMEVWSLAAHQAETVLAEMLGLKSSAELVALWRPDEPVTLPKGFNGYRSALEDWLFALLIEMGEDDDGSIFFSLADPEKVLQYAGPWGAVTSARGLDAAPIARFRCLEGGDRPCGFHLLDGVQISFPTTADGKKKKENVLCLGDLLAHFLLQPAGKLLPCGEGYELPLTDMQTGQPTQSLLLEFQFVPGKDTLRAVVHPAPKNPPVNWPKELNEVRLYGRFGASVGNNWKAEDLVAEFQKEKGRKYSVGNMRVACSEHHSAPVKGVKPFGQTFKGTPGGLFDPIIFGNGLPKAEEEVSNRWGYIELPLEVAYPLHVFLTPSLQSGNQTKEVEKLLKKHGKSLGDLPMIQRIPVLPARFRLPARRGDEVVADEIDRRGYGPLIRLCAAYQKETDAAKRAKIATQIALQVESIFRMLLEALRHKTGLIRRHGLGRRVDRSARLVVTPNPSLPWDRAGVPATVLLELMGDIVAAWHKGRSMVEQEEHPLPAIPRISWQRPKENPEALQTATDVLNAFLEVHPDYVVLLNRQPSLHRDSFQAFHPVPLPPESGEVVQICPLACKGFAADFDGDEMVVHVPLGEAEQAEALSLLPSKNLFSMANEAPANVMAHFDQDFVLGTWWLGSDSIQGGLTTLRKALPGACCRKLIPASGKISKEDGIALLHHLAAEHPEQAATCIEEWMRLAFDACSRMGVSFGYYELLDLADSIAGGAKKLCATPREKSNNELQDLAVDALERVLSTPPSADKPGLHFAAMALSGARGREQVRQILAARGDLDPGSTGFERDEAKFFFPRTLVHGLTPEQACWAAMNARSSMCDKKLGTGYAGGLTRHLVSALWPYAIVSNDCGNGLADNERSPVSCNEKAGFCAKCYGKLPDGKLPDIGFPAGLVAAQSIGERGTQLSMQSFHAGTRKIDIHYVRSILGLGSKKHLGDFNFRAPGEVPSFVSKFQTAKAYEKLCPRHLEVLWKALSQVPSRVSRPTLPAVIEVRDAIDRMAYRDAGQTLAEALASGNRSSSHSPVAKVILGTFATSNH